jgi:hypothetical protein
MVAQPERPASREQIDPPDECYLLEAATRQMHYFIAELGSGAIDSFTLRRSIRHLLQYGPDSELTALLEYLIVQAFKNVTHPTERRQLKRSLGKVSYLLQTRKMPGVAKTGPTRSQMTRIIALFEQLTRTADLTVQHIILEEIEREHLARKARARRDQNIRRVLGPA